MKTLVLILGITVVASVSIGGPADNRQPRNKTSENICVEWGFDYEGHDIDNVYNVNHWQDCARLCNEHRSCSFWSWVINEKRCIRKTSNEGRRPLGNFLSGAFDCLSEC